MRTLLRLSRWLRCLKEWFQLHALCLCQPWLPWHAGPYSHNTILQLPPISVQAAPLTHRLHVAAYAPSLSNPFLMKPQPNEPASIS